MMQRNHFTFGPVRPAEADKTPAQVSHTQSIRPFQNGAMSGDDMPDLREEIGAIPRLLL
jgi:hypothetical protein